MKNRIPSCSTHPLKALLLTISIGCLLAPADAKAQIVVGSDGPNETDTNNYSGAQTLTKIGSNTVALSGSNSYTGKTTISNGVLQAGTSGTMSTNSFVRVRGGSFDLNGTTNSVAGLILHNATITQAAGALTTLKPGAPDDSLKIAGEVGDVA